MESGGKQRYSDIGGWWKRLRLLGVVMLCLSAPGCEDPFIDPFVEGRHFTIYGYLNAFDDEHFVRVIAVRRFPEDIPSPTSPHADFDGVVTSTNLTTGVQHRWTHTLRELDDGSLGHVFTAAFVVRKGQEYELTVTRSDGETSVARTKVPNLNQMEAAPVQIIGDSTVQTITWVDAVQPEGIIVNYCAKTVGAFSCDVTPIDYGREGRRTETGWELDIQLSRDLDAVRARLGMPDSVLLELSSVDMLFTALDNQWILPAEPIDPVVFAQPGALTNVEAGFGFWGSASRSGAGWSPDAEALAISGYVPPGGSAPSSASFMSAHPTTTFQPFASRSSR